MGRAKRFYLCNLIPLWEIKDEHLGVDWTRKDAKDGEVVEMRVSVTDLDLNLQAPDFSIEFEIKENDYLLFGGRDDLTLTINSRAAEGAEHRPLVVLGEHDPPPPDRRLKNIFVNPVTGKGSTPSRLIRAFWRATWQMDIAGSPEFFFTVELKFAGKTYKERSDYELTVSKAGAAGTGAGTDAGAAATGAAGKTLTLPAAGWSRAEMFAEQTVNQSALLDKVHTGRPASFVITPDDNATLLWILFIPPRTDVSGGPALLKSPWKAPRYLPLENINALRLRATVGDTEVAATDVAEEVAERFPGQEGALFAEVKLFPGREKAKLQPSLKLSEQQEGADALLSADAATKKLKAELDAELKKWGAGAGKNLSPTDSDYAYTLQEYAHKITHASITDVEVKPRPAGGKSLETWKSNFRKSYLLGLMILTTGASVGAREKRAQIIAQSLVEAGFITEALSLLGLFTDRAEQEYTYEMMLKEGGKVTAAQWPTLLNFFTAGTGVFAESKLFEVMGFGQGSITIDGDEIKRITPDSTKAFIENLGGNDKARNEKLDVIVTALVDAYANDPDLVLALAGVLFFQESFRRPLAERLWKEDKGYLLFKILSAHEFNEPGYDEPTFDGKTLAMADMAWVYENKQRFVTDFLVRFCERVGVKLPRPPKLTFTELRSWLEAQTETIAGAAPKVFPRDIKYWLQLYAMVADVYFFHVEDRDVKPHLNGRVDKLVASEPNKLRLRADCDVFATYGTRFLRAMGFTSIGYMGIWKMEGAAYGIGHAGALLQKDDVFYIVNNKLAFKITAADEAAAHVRLSKSILNVLSQPQHYEVYYAPAEADGAMSSKLLERAPETRRKDLEPKNP
jgi:hypothetical protein